MFSSQPSPIWHSFSASNQENLKFKNYKNKESVEFSALMALEGRGEVIMTIDISGVTQQEWRLFLMILKLSGRVWDLLCEKEHWSTLVKF